MRDNVKEKLNDAVDCLTSKHLFFYGVITGYLINTFLGIPILTLIAIYIVVRFYLKHKAFVKKVVKLLFAD